MANILIKIYAVSLEPRAVKVMMFFISKFCVSRCVLTSDREQAEVFFIDMDSVKSADEGNVRWQSMAKQKIFALV